MRPVDSIPLQALGRVDGTKYQEVPVNVRRPRKVGTRGRRVEHELGDEVTNVLGVAGAGDELIKAPNAHRVGFTNSAICAHAAQTTSVTVSRKLP